MNKTKIKAEIKREHEESLWMHIHRIDGKGSSWAIYEDEVDAIRDACNKWKEQNHDK